MAVDKRKNVAVFPVTLWTDRWNSTSQFHTLLFLTWMLQGGGGGRDELKLNHDTNKSEEMWRTTLWMPFNAQRVQPAIPNPPNSSKLSQHFLIAYTWEACILLWFSGQNSLVIILLRSVCRPASPISTARHSLACYVNQAPWGSWCRSCDVQKIQCSPHTLASWSLLTPHLLQGGGSKSSLAPACSQASDLKEMGVLTDHGTRGYINM